MSAIETQRRRVFGVDFDNTLILYDPLFRTLAAERGLYAAAPDEGKKAIRDALRLLPGGEIEWQKLQAAAYGPRIAEGRLAEGAGEFLGLCRRGNVPVYVVSHKTPRAGYDETGTDLREAALGWMRANGLLGTGGLQPGEVFFASTRQEKIDRIRALGCTHFIDDLEETFLEETFPRQVEKLLFAPRRPAQAPPGVKVVTSWKEIREYLFCAGH